MCCTNLLPCVQVFWVESKGSGFNAEGCSTKGCFARQCQGFPGFRVWLSAKHPEGSDGSCIRFDNKLSRLCTLVDLPDV